MAIPDFQSILLPLLKSCGDGKEHTISDSEEVLAVQFKLTPEERKVRLPSGVQEVFRNRIGWAKFHLKMAGLLETPKRGVYSITSRGHEVLKQAPPIINLRFLSQFPEYVAFRNAEKDKQSY
jgi:restriction system protein